MRPWMQSFARFCARAALGVVAFEFACQVGQVLLWGVLRSLYELVRSRGAMALLFRGTETIEMALYCGIVAAMALLALGELRAAVAGRAAAATGAGHRVRASGVAILVLVGLVWLRVLVHAEIRGIPGWTAPAEQADTPGSDRARNGESR